MPGPQPKLLQPIRDALHALNYWLDTERRAPAKSKNRTAISGFASVGLKYSTIGHQPIFSEACSAFTLVATRQLTHQSKADFFGRLQHVDCSSSATRARFLTINAAGLPSRKLDPPYGSRQQFIWTHSRITDLTPVPVLGPTRQRCLALKTRHNYSHSCLLLDSNPWPSAYVKLMNGMT